MGIQWSDLASGFAEGECLGESVRPLAGQKNRERPKINTKVIAERGSSQQKKSGSGEK